VTVVGNLERPRRGDQVDGDAIEMKGWVFGGSQTATAVEAVVGGQVLHRVPVDIHRPDVAANYPAVAAAALSGFAVHVNVPEGEFEVLLRAVLADEQRSPIAHVRIRGLTRLLDDFERRMTSLKEALVERDHKVAEIEREREVLAARSAELEGERGALSARVDWLARGLEEYKQHAQALESVRGALVGRVEALEHERDDLVGRVEALEHERDDLVGRVEALEHERDEMRRELEHMRSSRSWRWTAPARRLVDGHRT
jgi:hypothetical protein